VSMDGREIASELVTVARDLVSVDGRLSDAVRRRNLLEDGRLVNGDDLDRRAGQFSASERRRKEKRLERVEALMQKAYDKIDGSPELIEAYEERSGVAWD